MDLSLVARLVMDVQATVTLIKMYYRSQTLKYPVHVVVRLQGRWADILMSYCMLSALHLYIGITSLSIVVDGCASHGVLGQHDILITSS